MKLRYQATTALAIFLLCGTAYAVETITTTVTNVGGDKVVYRHEAITDPTGRDVIVIKTSPPAPKEEVARVEDRPDPTAVWVPGYWQWNSDSAKFEWISGVWRREIPNNTWHPGQWIKVGDSWEWQRGYWAPKDVTQTVVIKVAPPEPLKETPGDPPGPNYIWVPGLWKYENGEHKWLPGSWERPASEGMSYSPGQWIKLDTGYQYIPGHWDYKVESRTYIVKP